MRMMIKEALPSSITPQVPDFPQVALDEMFQRTVPRRLVHRAAVSEVFVTDLLRLGDQAFVVGAQWPRSHSFFGLRSGGWHDPMLLAETIRQAALMVAHQGFGLAEDVKFLSHEKSFEVTPEGLESRDGPASIVLLVRCHGITYRRGMVGGMRLHMDGYRDGEWIARSDARMSCLPPRLYERVRGRKAHVDTAPHAPLPPPVEPCRVGRVADADVVLTETSRRDAWLLRLDRRHPVMFEHFVDHVPGMAIMEAGRQAAHLVLGRTDVIPLACDFTFKRYVELDEPCLVAAEAAADGAAATVTVTFVQDGVEAASGTLRMHPYG